MSSVADLFRRSGPQGRRIGRRVHTSELWIDWHPAAVTGRRRWGRRQAPAPRARVLDLSLTGAKVLVANELERRPRTEVRIGLGTASGRCLIRRAEPGPAGSTICGIQYLELEPALRDTINALVSIDRHSVDQQWEHAR